MAKTSTCNFTGKEISDDHMEHIEVDPMTFSNIFLPLIKIDYSMILRKIANTYMITGLSSRLLDFSKATKEDNSKTLLRQYAINITLYSTEFEVIKDDQDIEDSEKEAKLAEMKEKIQNKIGKPTDANMNAKVINVSSGFCTLMLRIVAQFEIKS